MSIRKRTWETKDGEQIAWVVDYKDQAGKRRLKTFARKKDAKTWWEGQAAYEIKQGIHTPDSASITIAEAAELWVRRGEVEELERGTLRYYRDMVEKHIKPIVGNVKLSRLTTPMVQEMRDKPPGHP